MQLQATRRIRSRSIVFVAVAAIGVVVLGGVAAAHVTVDPSTTAKGGFAVLTFRVPNEKADASTVKVKVMMPSAQPLAFVSVQPVPGWQADVTKTAPAKKVEVEGIPVEQVVGSVTWSGGEIRPGEFQEFKVSVGPMPTDTDALIFSAEQTYSNGDVVTWDQPTPVDGKEPDHPAPTVRLTAADTGTEGSATTTPAAAEVATASEVDAAGTKATVGIVVGAVGVLVGVAALVVAGRRSKTDAGTPGA